VSIRFHARTSRHTGFSVGPIGFVFLGLLVLILFMALAYIAFFVMLLCLAIEGVSMLWGRYHRKEIANNADDGRDGL
jgi:hypothetical protein